MPRKQIVASQDCWARARWPGRSNLRAPSLEANLIGPMTPEVRAEFAKGSGGELGKQGRPGKMCSLRSSSALTYNVFAPWSGHDLAPLAAAMGREIEDRTLRFERQFRHGLSSTPPNLDVALDNDQPRPLGIECKFTEPYGPKKPRPRLDEKYFVGGRLRWTELGLPRCQALAGGIGRTIEFKRLDAGQLLKHILGLAWATKRAPRLSCIWFDSKCEEASEFSAEVRQFASQVDPIVEFTPISYQNVFARLRKGPEPMPGYVSYLETRYFPG